MDTVAVIDFETTGLSPDQGERATEIAAVLVRGGKVVDRYQSLMSAGVRIPPFIESLTGITNDMIRSAPSASRVMREAADFVGDVPLIAHNASFDRKFWDAELARIRRKRKQEFACSMLVARRVFPNAPDHKLGTLAAYAGVKPTGRAHRALADAEMAAGLVLRMEHELIRMFQLREVSHELLRAIQTAPRQQVRVYVDRFCKRRHS